MTTLDVPVVVRHDDHVEIMDRTVPYELLDFPFESYRLLGGKDQLDAQEAETYVEWMIDTEPRRTPYAMDMFLACGAKKGTSGEWLSVNLDVSSWLMDWFPVTFAPWKGEPHKGHWWLDHHGHAKGPWFPSDTFPGRVFTYRQPAGSQLDS